MTLQTMIDRAETPVTEMVRRSFESMTRQSVPFITVEGLALKEAINFMEVFDDKSDQSTRGDLDYIDKSMLVSNFEPNRHRRRTKKGCNKKPHKHIKYAAELHAFKHDKSIMKTWATSFLRKVVNEVGDNSWIVAPFSVSTVDRLGYQLQSAEAQNASEETISRLRCKIQQATCRLSRGERDNLVAELRSRNCSKAAKINCPRDQSGIRRSLSAQVISTAINAAAESQAQQVRETDKQYDAAMLEVYPLHVDPLEADLYFVGVDLPQ